MDESHSGIESPSGRQPFIPLKVNCKTVLSRIFASKDTTRHLLRRLMNRILKWLLIIVLAEAAFLGVDIASNDNRRERLRQFCSGEPMQWERSDDSAGR